MTQPLLLETTYSMGGRPFTSCIEAQSGQHALQLAIARGLGERVHGKISRSGVAGIGNLVHAGKLPEALHEATFLSFIGLSSGVLTARETLGDTGLVHELAHWLGDLDDPSASRLERVLILSRDFERRVPGWPLVWLGK